MAVASLVLLGIEELGYFSEPQLRAVYVFDVVVGLIFLGELLLELKITTNKKSYIKSNWYYLFAAIPLPYTFAELLRGLRILRVIKLIRAGVHFEYEVSRKK
ncbi:ion transporter [Candidatus Saccharibacteria bacterium]|nr:ion transporter [Candidatus Saccharibacteria bacterium]